MFFLSFLAIGGADAGGPAVFLSRAAGTIACLVGDVQGWCFGAGVGWLCWLVLGILGCCTSDDGGAWSGFRVVVGGRGRGRALGEGWRMDPDPGISG